MTYWWRWAVFNFRRCLNIETANWRRAHFTLRLLLTLRLCQFKVAYWWRRAPFTFTLWISVLKELCKYPANISFYHGLKVLVHPPQNFWLLGNQMYACRGDLDEGLFACVFFCQYTQLTCQMTSLYYLLWVLFIMVLFHTKMSTCWLVGDREWSCL